MSPVRSPVRAAVTRFRSDNLCENLLKVRSVVEGRTKATACSPVGLELHPVCCRNAPPGESPEREDHALRRNRPPSTPPPPPSPLPPLSHRPLRRSRVRLRRQRLVRRYSARWTVRRAGRPGLLGRVLQGGIPVVADGAGKDIAHTRAHDKHRLTKPLRVQPYAQL